MKFNFFIFLLVIFVACTNQTPLNNDKVSEITDSLSTIKQDSVLPASQFTTYSDSAGVIGIFEVPEMLVFTILDSCSFKDAPFVMSRDYAILQAEIKECGAEIGGAPGCISYNNDTSNYVFECVIPIKSVAKKNPKRSKMVALSAGEMAIYNYYGTYNYLYRGYANLRAYIKQQHLQTNGPMREFYVTDAMLEKNPNKWLTRIMIPVKKKTTNT
jgi:effector-binding domain-containing protein